MSAKPTAMLDSSVLVAALILSEPNHDACRLLLAQSRWWMYAHGLAETFSQLTGGRGGERLKPAIAAQLIRSATQNRVVPIALSPEATLQAIECAQECGVHGGAIYDFLHLTAAREAGAKAFYTLNVRDFRPLHRAGDPLILHPADSA